MYLIYNPEGRFYVGHTDDLERRFAEHDSPEKMGVLVSMPEQRPSDVEG